MDSTSDGNPLAEVALALAMGFFSIMVLAMVSMAADRSSGVTPSKAKPAVTLKIADAGGPREAITITDQRIVIFHGGGYLNPDLTPFDPSVAPAKPLVLAIDPATSLSASMAARAGLGGGDVTMTVLDPSWINRLKGVKR